MEYECESVNVALYEGIEVEEFTDVILSSLHINGTIIGLKDTNGVILLPKFICQNVSHIQQTTYELVLKSKDPRVGSPITPLVQKKPTPKLRSPVVEPPPTPPRKEMAPDPELAQTLRYLKMDGFLAEAEEKVLLEMSRNASSDLLAAQQQYQKTGDFIAYKAKLKQLSNRRPNLASAYPYPQMAWQDNPRPATSTGYGAHRPLSAARWSESANINSTQAMLIGAVHDLEEKKLLDEQVVCTVKTLILEENPEVIKLLNIYIAHMIDERELCPRLQRLSDRMSTYIERPSSPLPRKNSLLEFVNTIASVYMRDKEDIALLQRLIEDENEFVLSAFDVFESDKDQENLLDTLLRIVAKFKRLGISKDSVTAAAFYDGGILPQRTMPMERPETRGQARTAGAGASKGGNNKRADFPLFSSESDSYVPGNEFRFRGENREEAPEEKSDDEDEPEAEAVELPSAGLVYVTRSKSAKPPPQEEEPTEPTFKDFEQTGVLGELRDEVVGTLRWAIKNSEQTLRGAYDTFKLSNDTKLFHSALTAICGKIFDSALDENLSKEQIGAYRERKMRCNATVMKLLQEFRKTGNLMELVNELAKSLFTKTPEPKSIIEERPKASSKSSGGMLKLFEIKENNEAATAKEEPKQPPPYLQPPQLLSQEESNDEATEKELAGDIFNTLETEGRISKDDIGLLNNLYKQGSKDVINALQEFKKDHDLALLGNRLSPLVKRKHKDESSSKKKKKKKYKTFEECIEFFKVEFCLINQCIE